MEPKRVRADSFVDENLCPREGSSKIREGRTAHTMEEETVVMCIEGKKLNSTSSEDQVAQRDENIVN